MKHWLNAIFNNGPTSYSKGNKKNLYFHLKKCRNQILVGIKKKKKYVFILYSHSRNHPLKNDIYANQQFHEIF